ncbi:MAG: prephenate dehydratase [Bacteroidetes bacterium]|nr:prephenate dehydratase [Bacteroidota bacterium]
MGVTGTSTLSVGYQGETGAYSEEAVEKLFPGSTAIAHQNFDDVFAGVVDGALDAGVVPIENSLFGSVHVNYDHLREFDVRIVAEAQVRIRHNLMALRGATLEGINEVRSHPQALGQCKVFLRTNLPQARVHASYDTAGAAKEIALGHSPTVAAIASVRAAEHYGLEILASGIESNHQNYTRFLALVPAARAGERAGAGGPSAASTTVAHKTSLVYAMHSTVPGALFNSLAVFASRNIDLLKIESRPLVGTPGSYLFYLDLDGRVEEESVANALQQLAESTDYIKVMGSYPRAAYHEAD